jgi:hypothetical protein
MIMRSNIRDLQATGFELLPARRGYHVVTQNGRAASLFRPTTTPLWRIMIMKINGGHLVLGETFHDLHDAAKRALAISEGAEANLWHIWETADICGPISAP